MVRGGGPVPSAAPGCSTTHKQARPLPGQECLVRGQEHHPDCGAQRLRVQIHPEQGLSGTVFQLQRPQHLPPVHRVPGSLRLLHASPVHVGNRDAGLPRQRGDPQGGQAGGEDPALQLPGVREGAEPRGSPVQRVPERRGEHAPRGARAPPLPPPPAGAGGAAGLQPPPPRGGGRGVTRPVRTVLAGLCERRGLALGREGGAGVFPVSLLPSLRPPAPRDVPRRRQG